MKTTKRIMMIMLAIIITATLALPAFAADQVILTLSNGADTPMTQDFSYDKNTSYTLAAVPAELNKPDPDYTFYKWSVKIGSAEAVEKAIGDSITLSADTTATALWAYTVKYNVDGGTPAIADVLVPVAGTKKITLPAKTSLTAPTNKTFMGWQIGSTLVAGGTEITVDGNLTVYARWDDIALVDFVANGGSGTPEEDYECPVSFSLPAFSTGLTGIAAPAGKAFAGWKVNDETVVRQPGELVTLNPGDNTLTPQWKDGTTDNNTVTINGAVEGHTFNAYQIFGGDVVPVSSAYKLVNLVWGANAGSAEDLADALQDAVDDELFSDTLLANTSFTTAIAALTADSKAPEFAEVFAIITSDTDDAKALAKILKAWVDGEPAKTTTTNSMTGVNDGYYLIVDAGNSATVESDFISDYMLEIVNDTTVNVKGSVPSLDKKISKAGASAGFEDTSVTDPLGIAVGDSVWYEIKSTFPTNYADYENYSLEFIDEMTKGLTLVYTTKEADAIVVKIDGTTVDPDDYTCTVTTDTSTGKKTVNVKFDDLKAATVSDDTKNYDDVYGITSASVVTIKYECKVNKDALAIDLVANDVYLKYSNDPRSTGTGKTPKDDTYIKPVSFKFVKTDGQTNLLLTGAKFSLYTSSAEDAVAIKLIKDEDNKYHIADAAEAATAAATTEIAVDLKAAVLIDGLDADDTYYLKETKAPTGYNRLDSLVPIKANDDTDVATATISTSYEYTTTANVWNVQNNAGAVLPETGGAGTVLIITISAVVFLGVMIVLVTKKRMYNEG